MNIRLLSCMVCFLTCPLFSAQLQMAAPAVAQALSPQERLFKSLKDRDIVALTALLANNISPVTVGKYGRTALHQAAEYGFDTAVALLLSRGASVSAVDEDQRTPLHMAAEKGHETTCLFLQTCMTTPQLNLLDCGQKSALAVAAANGYSVIVQNLQKAGANINSPTIQTPLYHAAMSSRFKESVDAARRQSKLIKFLRTAGAQEYTFNNISRGLGDYDEAGDKERIFLSIRELNARLLEACKHYYPLNSSPEHKRKCRKWAKALLSVGADADIKDEATNWRPIDFALCMGDVSLMAAISSLGAKRSDIKDFGAYKKAIDTYLLEAINQGKTTRIIKVLRAWPTYVPPMWLPEDIFGRSLVHAAARTNNRVLIEQLLMLNGFDSDEADSRGKTVLMHTLERRSPVAKMLIERTRNFLAADKTQKNLLFYAAESSNADHFITICSKILIQTGGLDFILNGQWAGKTIADYLKELIQLCATGVQPASLDESDEESDTYDDTWIGCASNHNMFELIKMYAHLKAIGIAR